MKKVSYLFVMFLALSLMSFSCSEKEEIEEPVVLTLADQYPDWVDLSWVSTDGDTSVTMYPKLEISIDENTVTVHHTYVINNSPYVGSNTYEKMIISGNTVTFGVNITGTFVLNGSQITITTFGLMNDDYLENKHVYVLQINPR